MVIFFTSVVLWIPFVATMLLRAHRARTPSQACPQAAQAVLRTQAPTQADKGGDRDGPAWSALDDSQLTKLLIDSAPRTAE